MAIVNAESKSCLRRNSDFCTSISFSGERWWSNLQTRRLRLDDLTLAQYLILHLVSQAAFHNRHGWCRYIPDGSETRLCH